MRTVRTPYVLTVLAALLLASAACNLAPGGSSSAGDVTTVPIQNAPTVVPPIYVVATSTPVAPPTFTPAPTLAPTAACVRPDGWITYTIPSGSTLRSLARATGTDSEILARVNCLSNPDYIRAGSSIFLPRMPVIAPAQPVFDSALTADPVWADWGGGLATSSQAVRIIAGTVHNVLEVNFYVSVNGGSWAIGQDVTGQDGFFINYMFPSPGVYTFWAVAHNGDVSQQSTQLTLRYDPVPVMGLSVEPHLGVQDQWYIVTPGQPVTITWGGLTAAVSYVDFWLTPYGTGAVPQLIGIDPYPGDGIALLWTPPYGTLGFVQAVAHLSDQSTRSSQIVGLRS